MSGVEFHYTGVGKLIAEGRLRVPTNQREYAWEEHHALALCNDIRDAIRQSDDSYFLGTVVLTREVKGHLEVVDGQQRLATITMIFAAIRDMFHKAGELRLVESIENQYLSRIDVETESDTPNLILNTRNQEHFLRSVILRPDSERRERRGFARTPSNQKIDAAATILRQFLEQTLEPFSDAARKDELKAWIGFLVTKAQVIVLTAADDVKAYIMFETLNDRGLKVSQADLVKNYLFGRAGSRLSEAQARWASIIGVIESVDPEDSVIDFLRLACTLRFGLTREREVFKRIKTAAASQHNALQYLDAIDKMSVSYAAILNPFHEIWKDYPADIRHSLAILHMFDVTQIRPLLLAVTQHFSKQEATAACKLFVNWIVRLFIAGTGRIGRVEGVYANLAHSINTNNDVRSAAVLAEKMQPYLATDLEFEQAFTIAQVSKGKIARYYLSAIERYIRSNIDSSLVPSEDINKVNLEHVMPEKYEARWAGLDSETAASYVKRIGNLTLLNASKNSSLGNANFEAKKKIFSGSDLVITQKICEFNAWGPSEIEQRQAQLAKFAVKVWQTRL